MVDANETRDAFALLERHGLGGDDYIAL